MLRLAVVRSALPLLLLTLSLTLKPTFGANVNIVDSNVPFNVDLKFPVHFPSDSVTRDLRNRNPHHYPSLFGASVVVTSRSDNKEHKLFIGSPNLVSKTKPFLSTGGVFQCAIDLKNERPTCFELDFSKRAFLPYAERNRSLIGFNLAKNGEDIFTCAPNWVGNFNTSEGLCLLVNTKSGSGSAFGLKVTEDRRFLRKINRPFQSHALFGHSIAYNFDNHVMFVGTPGLNDFSGGVYEVDGFFRNKLLTQNDEANSYSAMAIDYCSFGGSKDSVVIIGTPKHKRFNGRVDLFRYRSRNMISLFSTTEVKGEFFGASVLSVSTANNRKDLLIGAPLYSTKDRRELGRVYYYANIVQSFDKRTKPLFITPTVRRAGARFGTTLAAIDLNMDSFTDVIISAPFEDNFGGSSGALYFFYGNRTGLNIASEKRISPELLSTPTQFQGFGYSLWSQSDIDNNGYNDLVVGSVLSEKVSIFRSIPLTSFQVTLKFDRPGINLTDTSGCLNPENACFRVHYCIVTTSKNDFTDHLSYLVDFTVSDSKIRTTENRVILVDKISSVESNKKKSFCIEKPFYVELKKQKDIIDLITPIEVQVSVALNRSSMGSFCAWCPIADSVTVRREINFEHGCAQKQCMSQLQLSVEAKYGPEPIRDSIVQGQYRRIEFWVDVNNHGDPSLETYLLVSIKPFAAKLHRPKTPCVMTGDDLYACEVNGLLQKDQTERFKLHFDVTNVTVNELAFEFNLTTKSQLAAKSQIHASKRFSILKKASFKLIGDSFLNDSFSEQTPFRWFPISYLIHKDGPSLVNSTYVQLLLPDGVIEIDQSSEKYCKQVEFIPTLITDSFIVNETLQLHCTDNSCSRYECNIGLFQTNRQSVNFALTLMLIPKGIQAKFIYRKVDFILNVYLFTKDLLFFDANTPLAFNQTNVVFDKQASSTSTKASPLIMIGGGGIGLLILLIIVILLLRNGFFKRKKREEMLRVKQRMSMNPNMAQTSKKVNKETEEAEEYELTATTNNNNEDPKS